MDQENTTTLLPEGSPMDLMLRGFGRGQVLELTGEDIGYNGRRLRSEAAGVDRFAYKVAHVRQRVDPAVVEQALQAYAETEARVEEVLSRLGLANPNLVKLKGLFAALGGQWAEKFAAADSKQRGANMRRGFTQKHGVDNPFKLAEFQEAAADTREAKYGARYTLAAGSSLAPAARIKINESNRRATDHH